MGARVKAGWRAHALRCALGGVLVLGTGGGAACGRSSHAAVEATSREAQLFDRACARCHGADASGGLPMATGGPKPIDLRGADWQGSRTDEEISAAISDGRGAMPPFNDVLTPSEIGALTGYIRRMAERAPQ